ncbi:Hypothetical protein PAS_chr2-2_0098 [Komagataella phaffii GS115]|uniref:Uncharacterized protein n=1 Tax=Komagataella phaffii (strain GS115 / ATCC 20864) TaxID=644223 RepID=C4R2V5_KOMPG|nr:Hypothetical protein PAS_chr2-2_0098 [Komagataella phaffii GS115]CAY69829.1 Hypothetical protein PAS_chr2-2_0098 [Komagataella phaffii GS115]
MDGINLSKVLGERWVELGLGAVQCGCACVIYILLPERKDIRGRLHATLQRLSCALTLTANKSRVQR